jgi:hypothetical protein
MHKETFLNLKIRKKNLKKLNFSHRQLTSFNVN